MGSSASVDGGLRLRGGWSARCRARAAVLRTVAEAAGRAERGAKVGVEWPLFEKTDTHAPLCSNGDDGSGSQGTKFVNRWSTREMNFSGVV
jgi:hypothetical protein